MASSVPGGISALPLRNFYGSTTSKLFCVLPTSSNSPVKGATLSLSLSLSLSLWFLSSSLRHSYRVRAASRLVEDEGVVDTLTEAETGPESAEVGSDVAGVSPLALSEDAESFVTDEIDQSAPTPLQALKLWVLYYSCSQHKRCRYRGECFELLMRSASGGMPPAHSAAVTALAVSIGLGDGFDGSLFAVAAVMTCMVSVSLKYHGAHLKATDDQQARLKEVHQKLVTVEKSHSHFQNKLKEAFKMSRQLEVRLQRFRSLPGVVETAYQG